MVSGGQIVKINSVGMSTKHSEIYDIYNEKIKAFLESTNFGYFGSADEEAELRRYKFQNVTSDFKATLQSTINRLLLTKFPEIDTVDIQFNIEDQGLLGFKVFWKLTDEVLETGVVL